MDRLASTLEAELTLAQGEPDRESSILFELGLLEEEVRGDLRAARTRFRATLEVDAAHIPAIRALRRIELRFNNVSEAIRLLQQEIALLGDDRIRATTYVDLGHLHELRDEFEQAVDAYLKALELDPANHNAYDALIALYQSEQQWVPLSEILLRCAGASQDHVRRAYLTARAGLVRDALLGQEGPAEALLATALRQCPREALGAAIEAEGIASPTSEPRITVDSDLTLEEDVEQSTSTIDIVEDSLSDDFFAHKAGDPSGVIGLVSGELARLYRNRGRWTELAQLEQNEAGYTEDVLLKSFGLYRAGRLYAERVGDFDTAEDCFLRASNLRPDDSIASWALAEIRQRRGDFAALEQTLCELLPRLRDRESAIMTLFEIAHLRIDKLSQRDRGISALRQALELNPHHVPTLRALEDILVELEQYEDLVDVIQGEVDRTRDPVTRADVYFELAQLVERHLEDSQRAAFLYRAALDLVPGHCPAMDALERLLTSESSWSELVTLLEEGARVTEDSRRAANRLARAAQVCEHRLDDPNRAIDLTLQVLDIRRDDLDAICNLGHLLEKTERWSERITWLRKEVDLSTVESEKLSLLMSIGRICEIRLDAPELARETYREVVARDPQNRGALRALEQLDRRAGHHEALIDTLLLERNAALSTKEVASTNFRIGKILDDRLGRLEDAIAMYRAALEAEPRYRPAVHALERLLSSLGRWEELALLLETQARLADDPHSQATDWYRVGELREERLGDEQGARKAYLEALKVSPELEPARIGIARILEGQGEWAYVAEELAATATRLEGKKKLAHLVRLAALRVLRLSEPRAAVAALNDASGLSIGDTAVHELLVQVCRTQKLWERLGPAYSRLAKTISEPLEAAAILHRAALDAQGHPAVGDRSEIYQEILDLDPSDRSAITSLESQALMSNDHRSLLSATEQLLTVEGNRSHQLALLLRKGRLLTSIGDDAGGYEAFKRALDQEPGCLSALVNLIQIVESQQRYEELAELYKHLARFLKENKGKTKALLAAGQIHLSHLKQRDEASECFSAVMEIEPGNLNAFQLLSGILEESERWPELAEAIRARLATITDENEEITLRLRLSTIERDRLGTPETALKTLGGLLEIDPENRNALESLGGLYATVERWREAAESFEKAISSALVNGEAKAAHRCRLTLAEIQLHHLDEFDLSISTIHAILEHAPSDVDALRLLVEAHRKRAENTAVASTLNLLANALPQGERSAVLLDLSTVRRDLLGDFAGAGEALQRAIVDSPRSEDLLYRLREHYGRNNDWNGLAQALTWIVEQLRSDPSTSAEIRVELAKTLIERLDKVAAGVEHLESVLTGSPANPSARFAMARRHLLPPGRPDLAEEQYREVLMADPWNVEALRLLFGLLATGSDPTRAATVGMLLAYLGDSDAAKMAQQARTPARRTLGARGYHEWVASAAEPIVFCNLLRSVQSSLERVYPPDLERHGTSRDDRSTGMDHLSPAVEEVSSRLGIEGCETYVSKRNRHVCAVEPGDPPKVIVGVGLRNLSAGTRRFELGRVMSGVIGGSVLFNTVPRRELPSLLSAIIATNVKGYSRMGQPSEVADLTKRVGRALPRKLKKLLEEDARAAAAMTPPDIDAWVDASAVSADRCGLLACADIGAAIDAVRSREDHRSPLPHESFDHRIAALRGYQPAESLVRFWLSAQCEEALRQIGTF